MIHIFLVVWQSYHLFNYTDGEAKVQEGLKFTQRCTISAQENLDSTPGPWTPSLTPFLPVTSAKKRSVFGKESVSLFFQHS